MIARESDGQPLNVTGDDPYVADYLYREALTRQPEDIQRFLRRTAVLDQLYGPLCDAVLGSSASAGRLRHLEATNLFLIPLDRRRQWYRYHALFREFLLGELSRSEPDVITTLHERAADWYEANGSPQLALEHLLHTADWDRSVRLTAKLCLPTYMAGHLSTVQRWLAAIGDANIERYPPLAVLACWEGVLTGDPTRALRWAAVVDAASFDIAPASGTASFESARAMLRAGMCATGPDSMVADAALAVGQESAWSPRRAASSSASRRSSRVTYVKTGKGKRAPTRGWSPDSEIRPSWNHTVSVLARFHIGWFRRPGEARGAGQVDPGNEPAPRAHGCLDKPGIDAAEPELAAADQPHCAVAARVAPGEK